jgi:membrane-bound acyltransferase YfiQ involved in biofilm formation
LSRPRLGSLDILRALAAVAVVLIHTTASLMATMPRDSESFLVASLANQWARFSIPAFVLITGIVLAYGYGPAKEFKPGLYLWKRLRAIAIPYLAWSVGYMLFRAYVERNWTGLPGKIGTALFAGTAMYQLYFIVLIFQFYLFFILVRPLLQKAWFPWVVLGALLLQFFLMADTWFGWVHPTGPVLTWAYAWRDRLFPWWIGYFFLGAWIGSSPVLLDHLRRWLWPLTGVSGALLGWMMIEYVTKTQDPTISVGFAATGFRPTAFLYSIVACGAILGWGGRLVMGEGRLRLILDSLGRHSFGIYLIHPLLLWALDRFLVPLHLHPMLYLGAVTGALLALSWGATHLIQRLPGGRLVMGN